MEEEEGPYNPEESPRLAPALASLGRQLPPEIAERYLEKLLAEREKILDAIGLDKLSAREKLRLLQENRLLLSGKSSFRTEKVIYGILVFSAVVLITLACLTAFAGLAKEVTITFAGTVVGGTIATIAQKLGKVGR